VTEFYAELLKRISLPYKELDMTRRTDREMMDDLRIRTCIMLDVSEIAVTLAAAMLIGVCTGRSNMWQATFGNSMSRTTNGRQSSTNVKHSINRSLPSP